MAKRVLTHDLSEPLDGATAATIDINTGTGNLTIDRLAGGERLLARGTVEYMEGQDPPQPRVDNGGGRATFALKAPGGRQASFRMPWSACNAATTWQIHLNPTLPSDITAHSGGGNLKLNLAGMALTRLLADSGGGNLDVTLPDNAADLSVRTTTGGGNVAVEVGSGTRGTNTLEARSGAGNVSVRVPGGIAARIYATSGMGKIVMDARFGKTDDHTYQSPGYDNAADKIEMTLQSGAGNVIVESK